MALTQKKICKNIFGVGPPWARGHSLKVLELRFSNARKRLQATVLEISG